MSYLSLYRPHHPTNAFDSEEDLSIRQRRAARQSFSRHHAPYSGTRTSRAYHSNNRHYYDDPREHYPEELYDERFAHEHSSEVKAPEQPVPSGPLTTYIYSKCKHVEKCQSSKGGGGRFIKKGFCDSCILSQTTRQPKSKSNVKLVRGEGGRLMYVREA